MQYCKGQKQKLASSLMILSLNFACCPTLVWNMDLGFNTKYKDLSKPPLELAFELELGTVNMVS